MHRRGDQSRPADARSQSGRKRRRLTRSIALGLFLVMLGGTVALSMTTNHSYVTTPSMYPTIPPGSEVFISHETTYHVGDVIEFRANGLTWAHRLIGVRPNGSYITKGDNPQNDPDVFVPEIMPHDVIGKVVYAPRWVGFPELILHHPVYGMQWLRAELGLRGKMVLVGLGALVMGCWAFGGERTERVDEPVAEARHRRPDDQPATVVDRSASIDQLLSSGSV